MHSLEVAPAGWRAAGRRLVAKMLSELTYEDLLQPAHLGDARYLLELPHAVTYRFSARRRLFDSWRVEAESVERIVDGVAGPADDPLRLVVDAREAIGIAPDTAARLVHELATTLLADAEIADRGSLATDVLAELDYARLEGEMTGHPWIVFNKGRLGFGECDRRRYAPESRRPQPLPWIAIHEEISTYNAVCGLDHPRLLDFELDTVTRARFVEAIRERGDPDRYRLLPVHPWQWDRMVLPLLASEIAEGRIVPLGEGPDRYLPQQSIRTFTNVASPLRHHVKLALSVLNTAVYRGLPKRPTALAPRVTAYMRRLRDADPYLRDECRVAFLGEVASVTCDHPVLDAIPGAPYQYREVLGCIWREPIAGELAIGERARTLAALLHVPEEDTPLVRTLVDRSGLGLAEWLGRLLESVLNPLLHLLYRYGIAFSPHGENTILVSDCSEVPSRLAVKDFAADLTISNDPLPERDALPDDLAALVPRRSPAFLCQHIQSGLLICHFRYLSDICEDHFGFPERSFWRLVREYVLAYQERFPAPAERYTTFDMLAPEIERVCLHRNRLLLNGYADRPERPTTPEYGRVRNALAEVR